MSNELDSNYEILKDFNFTDPEDGKSIKIFNNSYANWIELKGHPDWVDPEFYIGDYVSSLTSDKGDGLDAPITTELKAVIDSFTFPYKNFAEMPNLLKWIVLTSTSFRGTFDGEGGKAIKGLYSFISTQYTAGSNNVKKVIVHRIKRMFNMIRVQYSLKTPDEKPISPESLEIFNLYDNILVRAKATEAGKTGSFESTKETRSLITQNALKSNSDSEFLVKRFGTSTANEFSNKAFKNAIVKKIQEYIDMGVGAQQLGQVNGVLADDVLNPASDGDNINYVEFKESEMTLLTVTKSKVNEYLTSGDAETQKKKNIIKLDKGSTGGTSFGGKKLKTDSAIVPWDSIRDSAIYSNPLRFNELKVYDIELYDKDHTESDIRFLSLEDFVTTLEPPSEASTQRLVEVYDPTVVNDPWYWFATETFDPKLEDLILGHYLRFLNSVKIDVNDDNDVDNILGEYFDWEVQDISIYLIPILAKIRQELIISSLLKQIEASDDPSKLDPEDTLDKAEADADKNLNDIPTSDFEEKELSAEDIEKRQKLYKQCALLLNAHKLKKDYKMFLAHKRANNKPMHKSTFFNGRFWMVEDGVNSNSILNKLTNPPGEEARPFLNITPDIHAALQPRLRLHKVYEAKEDGEKVIKTHEVPFDSFYPKHRSDGLSTGEGNFDKGAGFGIKEFSFSFDGETPATAQKFVKAKLSLFFQTFNDFIKVRKVVADNEEYEFRYLDLFVNTKFCPQTGVNRFSPLYYDPSFYRLRVDVGWEPRNDKQFAELLEARGTTPAKFNDTLNKTNKTFYLNLVDHTINIGEDGSVTIDADYIAYMQGVLQSNSFNALSTRYTRERQREYVKEYEKLLSGNKCTDEELAELVAGINSINDKIARSLHQGIVKKLVLSESLYSVSVDSGDMNDFRNKDFFSKIPNISVEMPEVNKKGATANAKNEDALNAAIQSDFLHDSSYQENRKIYFFFMGDLLYHVLDSLYKEDGSTQIKEAENLKLILSTFSYKNPFLSEECYLNIGEIPIDLDTFLSWYEREIIEKEIFTMPILTFVKRLLHYLIQDVFLETCINRQEHKRLAFQTTTFLADEQDGGKDPMNFTADSENSIFESIIDVSKYYGDFLPLTTGVKFNSPKPTAELYNYLFIFPHYRSAEHEGRGIASLDENRGVYHLYIGADKGLTKKISFSKSDIQYIRESRMMQQGSNGLLQLSSVYRASISMIGNTLFYPGMEVYINPFGFGGLEFGNPYDGPGRVDSPNLSNIMGIGGYYQIMKVNSKISPGSFTTDIDAHFVYSGDGKPLGRDGLKKVELCGDLKDISKGEEDNECRTVILKIENELLNTDATSGGSVTDKEEEAEQ
jgi:hypothetical protein